jgi:hypothetical protein
MDNTLILSLTAMLLGFAGIAIKICFASKCTSVEIGCIKIHRNVEIEPYLYTINQYKNIYIYSYNGQQIIVYKN